MMKRLRIAAAGAASNDHVIIFKENCNGHLSYSADINLRLRNWLGVPLFGDPILR